ARARRRGRHIALIRLRGLVPRGVAGRSAALIARWTTVARCGAVRACHLGMSRHGRDRCQAGGCESQTRRSSKHHDSRLLSSIAPSRARVARRWATAARVRKIEMSSGARLQPLAVSTLDSCGYAPAPCRYPRSLLPPTADMALVRLKEYPVTFPPAHVSAARNRPGVTPISRRKMELRWLWSAKPASCVIEPTLDDIALGTYTDRLLERATEMVGAEASHPGEVGQAQLIIKMRFDVVTHPPQPLRRQTVRWRERDRRRFDKTPRYLNCECRVECIGEDPIEEPGAHLVGDGQRYLRHQRIAKSAPRLEMHGTASHQIRNEIVVSIRTLQDLNKSNRRLQTAP